MKRSETPLARLLKAAKTVSRPVPAMPPEALKNRILSRWHSGALEEEVEQWLLLAFRRALVCASLLMVLLIAWSYHESTGAPESEVAISDYELRTDLMP